MSQTRALEEKEAIISGMREQLTKAREHLTSKQQVSCEQFQYALKHQLHIYLLSNVVARPNANLFNAKFLYS